MSKEILINQLFAGKYLNEGENIGHEVINLFSDDEGNHNLFITPSGRVKGHDLEYIVFVRNVSARRIVEIVGVAQGIMRLEEGEMDKIKYAGVSLDKIFDKNKKNGETDPFTEHVTFRAEKFLLPSQRLYITIEDNTFGDSTIYLDSERQVIIPQGMREYYSEEVDPRAYKELKRIIENPGNWDMDKTTERLIPDAAMRDKMPTFLDVIRKEDDENIFSNLLAYYFEYSHPTFLKFASNPEFLNIPNMSASFELHRETVERVDLWIESDNDIIVIENKIKSGINGITGDDYSQLNKYRDIAEKKAEKCGKKAHYFIFAPDYARFDLSQFGLEGKYTIIRYSELYRFFMEEAEVYIADRFFPDFLCGLKRHTLSFSELQFETMRSRLLRRISLLQE